jgi:Ni,Fe-hydrogenase I cytochrome b subunit
MISYCVVFVLVIFQILSGFALQYPDGWFSWLNYGIFNNEINTRIAHYVVNWLLVFFMIIHVYMNIRENVEEMKAVHLMRRSEEK